MLLEERPLRWPWQNDPCPGIRLRWRPRTLALVVALLQLHGGVAVAGGEEARSAYLAGDSGTALREGEPAAAGGDPVAQNVMGLLYLEGKVVPRDAGVAIGWFTKSAAQGFAKASTNLGRLYLDGALVPKDEQRALSYFQDGVRAGDAAARYLLGKMYEDGTAVERSLVRAEALYRAAIEGGVQAYRQLAGVYRAIGMLASDPAALHAQPARDQPELRAMAPTALAAAARWYRKAAAELGDHDAAGHYVALAQYDRQAGSLEFLRELARSGHDDAAVHLSLKAPTDAERLQWLRVAAERDNLAAMGQLAVRHYHGRGVPKDLSQAKDWLERASGVAVRSSAADLDAQVADVAMQIGDGHATGKTLPKDGDEATRWYRIAMNLGGRPGVLEARIAALQATPPPPTPSQTSLREPAAMTGPHAWSASRQLFPVLFWHALNGTAVTTFDDEFDGIMTISRLGSDREGSIVKIRCVGRGSPGAKVSVLRTHDRFWRSTQEQPFVRFDLFERLADGKRGRSYSNGYVDPYWDDNKSANVFEVLVMNAEHLDDYRGRRDELASVLSGLGLFGLKNSARRAFAPDPDRYRPTIDLDAFVRAAWVQLTMPRLEGLGPLEVSFPNGVSSAFARLCAGQASRADVREEAIIEDHKFGVKLGTIGRPPATKAR